MRMLTDLGQMVVLFILESATAAADQMGSQDPRWLPLWQHISAVLVEHGDVSELYANSPARGELVELEDERCHHCDYAAAEEHRIGDPQPYWRPRHVRDTAALREEMRDVEAEMLASGIISPQAKKLTQAGRPQLRLVRKGDIH